ncbi:Protein pxr1 [Penicillium macrosclerotiorum]|uniref:Protein pxr1 n=1 Tax=Penicillium macrosclerotiorum TaxID=303699 RepID=UPI002546E798|nr:Protein pxr1 [Penicillium macrosclerotiorum]KAJ5664761.1 Protein pxr1 [Penicillium macrosclerotiorum]
MGLAAPRKKTKISHDPNNTKWARSTSGFGHRIMSAQGWTPGGRLGARDAAHADFLTNASVSHIRVTVKDDTLGLGARAGRENEPTGLDAFKGLLGRLNGKSDEELNKEQRKRDDVKLARYVAMKFQEVRFVRGGLLTQEKLQALPEDDQKKSSTPATKETSSEDVITLSSDSTDPVSKSSKSKSKSKSKSSKKSRSQSDEADDLSSATETKKEKKSKKKSNKRKADDDGSDSVAGQDSSAEQDHQTGSKAKTDSPVAVAPRERLPIGRQLFRSRHIAQKKRALMDDKSLKEIFMVKA